MATKDCGYIPYEPQLRPVGWASDIWIVNGPEVSYKLASVTIPCPTRMTLIRLQCGRMIIHSPVLCDPGLVEAIAQIGPVSAIIAPNLFHYTHFAAWADRFPQATLHALPGLNRKIGVFPVRTRNEIQPDFWCPDVDVHVVNVPGCAEAVLFHRPSRTLVITDFMQNFEADRVRNPFVRFMLRAGGATGPNGKASIEIRMAAYRHRLIVRQAVEHMLGWNPSSIILAHGRCYETNAADEIKRAFAWAR